MGKKKFIDKKNSATFRLYVRDSGDPNCDETAINNHVFVRVDENTCSRGESLMNDGCNSIFEETQVNEERHSLDAFSFGAFSSTSPMEQKTLPEHVRKEILQLGFPDDGYNYLLHLRDIKNTGPDFVSFHKPKASLHQLTHDLRAYDASALKITEIEKDEFHGSFPSAFSKSVPVEVEKVIDPEVAASLDACDSLQFGSDVDLEDDFVLLANQIGDKEVSCSNEKETLLDESHAPSDEANTSNYQLGVIKDVWTKRVKDSILEARDIYVEEMAHNRSVLDEQFDSFVSQEYKSDDEDNVFDCDEGEEEMPLAEELKRVYIDTPMDGMGSSGRHEVTYEMLRGKDVRRNEQVLDVAADVVQQCLGYAQKLEDGYESQYEIIEQSSDESEKWDCETIISTYSNLDNLPAKIDAPVTGRKKLHETLLGASNGNDRRIYLRGKEKIPLDFLPQGKRSSAMRAKGATCFKAEQQKKQSDQESKVGKKERKAAVKEGRRDARRLKKETKGLYKCEAQRAQKVVAVSGPPSIHLI